jgi:hypothetical protein
MSRPRDITNNKKICRVARLNAKDNYEKIFWSRCDVHFLNFMLAKMGNTEKINKTREKMKGIKRFVTNNHMSPTIYQQFSKLELLKLP